MSSNFEKEMGGELSMEVSKIAKRVEGESPFHLLLVSLSVLLISTQHLNNNFHRFFFFFSSTTDAPTGPAGFGFCPTPLVGRASRAAAAALATGGRYA